MHDLTSTSRPGRSCMVANYLVKHQKGMTCENLRVHTVFRGDIGSTHRGIFEIRAVNGRLCIEEVGVDLEPCVHAHGRDVYPIMEASCNNNYFLDN